MARYRGGKSVFAAAILVAVGASLSACAPGSEENPPSNAPFVQSSDSSRPSATSSSSPSGPVSRDEAGTIATGKYGGTVKNIDDDHYQGKAVWEVEVRNSDQGRIEVKVEKATGGILHVEVED